MAVGNTQNALERDTGRVLVEGKNCWRIAGAHRAAFLIDAASYFAAFASAVEKARKSILIIGWDIDSRVELVRGNRPGPLPTRLGDFLNAVVSRRRGLHAHVLMWDFAMIYALERELLPIFKLGWSTHRRLHFRLDGKHPIGASHHQKIVVVDDRVAFVGGIDLSKCRWDTPEHAPSEPLRVDLGCGFYAPFHDVQMVVEGDVAAALGDLARERWRRSVGRSIKPPGEVESDPWPDGVSPDIQRVDVAIARTAPAMNGTPEVREVEALYVDSIAAARCSIYIENQYFTCTRAGDELVKRLQEVDGPEIVLVIPRRSSGWLEVATMDALRARLLRRLHEADRFGRLRVYHPVVAGVDGPLVNVHAKVFVADDTLVRVGSSNLSNRSMGFDTECDLAIEAGDEERTREMIATFRNRLLAEHLDVTLERVAEAVSSRGSLIDAIETLRGSERTLVPLEEKELEGMENWVYDIPLIDPERPADPSELIEQFIPPEVRRSGRTQLLITVGTLLTLLALAAAWQWTPLKSWMNLDTLLHWADHLRGNPMAVAWVIATYTLGGLVIFPVTLLVVVTAITFGPVTAFVYSLLGCLASAAALFGIGHLLGRETVRRFAGSRLNRLSRRLARRGLLTVITIRLFPVAPYSVVNFVAGASHIRFRDFVIGTVIGLAPGLLAITILGDSLGDAIRRPSLKGFLIVAGLVVFFVAANIVVRRQLEKHERKAESKNLPKEENRLTSRVSS